MQECLKIYHGALPRGEISAEWEAFAARQNCGALCIFVGLVRAENGVSALSFDIYEPILHSWFGAWQERAKDAGAAILMAHAKGDVKVGESSYMCAIVSPNRAAALGLYADFIEDFKHNAPIWKYDIINGERIYAQNRSKKLKNAGIL